MTRSPEHSKTPAPPLKILTTILYLSLLAGSYTFARVGLPNPLYGPERIVVPCVIAVFAGGFLAAARPSRAGTIRINIPIYLLLAYVAVTSFWAPSGTDNEDVLIDVLGMIAACIAMDLLLQAKAATVTTVLMWLLLTSGVIFSIAGLLSSSSESRISAFGGGPNVYGRVTVLGIVGLVWLCGSGKIPTWCLASSPLFVAATILSGSRGAMLSAVVVVLVLLPVVLRGSRRGLIAAATLTLGAGVLAYRYAGDSISESIQGRVVKLTFEDGYSSGRGPLLDDAVSLFGRHPLVGGGLQSFSLSNSGGFTYPHNLFLMVGAEGGIIGLALLLFAVVGFAKVGFAHRGRLDVRCWAAAALTIFTSAMFSGGYYDSRFLWIFVLGTLVAAKVQFVEQDGGDGENVVATVSRGEDRPRPSAC